MVTYEGIASQRAQDRREKHGEVWLRAWCAAAEGFIARGYNVEEANVCADECLTEYRKRFDPDS